MNPCIKTGLVFLDLQSGRLRTGDLFTNAFGEYLALRGVSSHDAPMGSHVHLWIDTLELQRMDTCHMYESVGPVIVRRHSKKFADHIALYYPELDPDMFGNLI